MKKYVFLTALAFSALIANSQNIQLHYDFGRNLYPDEESTRQKVTLTLEQFKSDDWGSWYYFVDVDLSRKETLGAYTEISREFNLTNKLPFAIHVEYDGGLGSRTGSYQQAALAGVAYNGNTPNFTATWSLQLLYKRFFKNYDFNTAFNSVQLTGVWGVHFLNRKMSFLGFIDFWRSQKTNDHGQLVILSEPQLWYNFTNHLSIGSEVEISNNFIYNTINDKTFFVNPTLAVKWNF
ncbi:MAG: DUF5020 family protein [Prevotella sp.]|nr:DUF5020 family protein [Prevotella sp.]MBR5748569.1 DUF5020 family protein [Prevotella sp.]